MEVREGIGNKAGFRHVIALLWL